MNTIRNTKAFFKILLVTGALLFGSFATGFAADFDLVLQWDENTEPDLAVGENPRYKIYYKTGSSGSGNIANYIGLPGSEPQVADEGPSPVTVIVAMDENPDPGIVQFTLYNLEDSQSYFIAVTALDASGNESDLSTEVVYYPAAVPTNEDADEDNDGIPDAWEIENGLDPTTDDAGLDPDGDGISNLDEYLNNTHPYQAEENYAPQMPELVLPEVDALVGLTPELVISAFVDPNPEDVHAETEWEIFLDVEGEGDCVYTYKGSSALTNLQVPSLVLNAKTNYAWRARVYDNRSAASAWSDYGYFTTGEDIIDIDGDGIADDQVPDAGTDMDGNGINDMEEVNIKSIRIKGKGTLVGMGTDESPGVVKILSLRSIDTADMETPGDMPYGLIDFKVKVSEPGASVDLIIYFSEKLTQGVAWYKYDSVHNTWHDASAYISISPNMSSLTLTLTDGGPLDADGLANGMIIDPAGLVVLSDGDDPVAPPADDNAPVAASASGGSGGCFIDAVEISSEIIPERIFLWGFIGCLLIFLVVNRNYKKQ